MQKKQKFNVILIVMDTVRADHLSCYGYHRKTTPNIDKLANKGVVFENAFSASTWTPPSHASIFSGKYPFQHGTLGKNVKFREKFSLASVLQRHGYRTVGITDCCLLSSVTGFDRGFDLFINTSEIPLFSRKFIKEKFKDIFRTILQGHDKHTYRINEIIKKILNSYVKEKPFFLFINYFNAHVPYNPPKPFRNKFTKDNSGVKDKKIKRIASGEAIQDFLRGKISISKREWDIVISLYDGELAYLDYRLSELFKFLEDKGIIDDTFLIITSDHGEYFGEHGLAGHVLNLYDEIIHVPLIMMYPKHLPNGERISNIVSTVDIFPTVIDLLGIKSALLWDRLPGVSLRPFENKKFHEFIFAESDYVVPEEKRIPKIHKRCKCIRTESHKYIYSPESEELYDLIKDPSEQTNLAQKFPEKVSYFKKILNMVIQLYGGGLLSSRDREIIRRLRKDIM